MLLAGCATSPSKQMAVVTPVSEPVEEAPPRTTLVIDYTKGPAPIEKSKLSPRDTATALRFIAALVELEKVRQTHPNRSEAIYNEAILVQEYGNLLGAGYQESALLAT